MVGGGGGESQSLEFTPTWVLAVVCFIIVLIALVVERSLHKLGKYFKRKNQDSLYEALEKLKEELMLLGFISLLLTLSQNTISRICIPTDAASLMLPCKVKNAFDSSESSHFNAWNGRRLLAEEETSTHSHCRQGNVPLLSREAVHHLQIFIIVLVVVHVVFCVSAMLLGRAKIKLWKHWENSIKELQNEHVHRHHIVFIDRAGRYWGKFTVVSVLVAFFKQFYGTVTKSDYIALRTGFIRVHCPSMPNFDFHKYVLRTLEHDSRKLVRMNWFLWLFAIIFLLLNIAGWHTYFWLSFLPLVLLLLVGAKLEYIITKLAKEVAEAMAEEGGATSVKPSDELFWFHSPILVLYLIHFILFQTSFEIAFLVWVWTTYGFRSCIIERLAFIIPRIIVGVIVQVLCSYSTFPLYALVTQMGSRFKQGIFDAHIHGYIMDWAQSWRRGGATQEREASKESHSAQLVKESFHRTCVAEQPTVDNEITASVMELTHQNRPQMLFS